MSEIGLRELKRCMDGSKRLSGVRSTQMIVPSRDIISMMLVASFKRSPSDDILNNAVPYLHIEQWIESHGVMDCITLHRITSHCIPSHCIASRCNHVAITLQSRCNHVAITLHHVASRPILECISKHVYHLTTFMCGMLRVAVPPMPLHQLAGALGVNCSIRPRYLNPF